MATGTVIAVLSLITAVAGTAVSIKQNRQAADEREKSEDLDRRQLDIENQKRVTQSIEKARIARGQQIAAANAAGASDSSGLAGGLSSASTQLAANVGFAQQVSDQNRFSNRLISRANKFTARANTSTAIASLPSSFGFDPASSAELLRNT